MSEISKYCATFDDGDPDEVSWVGEGDCPDEAYIDLINNSLDEYCSYALLDEFQEIKVFICTRVSVEDSDFDESEVNPEWEWVIDETLETRVVTLSEYNENRNP